MADEVVLELRDGDADREGDAIEASAMDGEDWIELIARRECRVLLRVSKARLSEKSSYFRSLFGDFREAKSDRVVVTWNLDVLARILQGIILQRLEVASDTVANLLEGAAFFGCDCIIAECEAWVASEMLSCSSARDNDDVLQYVPRLWRVSSETGVPAIARACARYLAVNFDDVASTDFLEKIPDLLFESSISHPFLTVSSEKKLLEAILRRFETRDPIVDLLTKVRLLWLPLDVVAGHLDILMPFLSSFPSRGHLLEPSTAGFQQYVGLRLSQYTKTLDLTGCQQVTDATLFDAVLCAPISIDGSYILHSFLQSGSSSSASPAGPFLNHLVSLYPLPENRTRFKEVQLPSASEAAEHRRDRPEFPILSSLRVLHLAKCWRVKPDQLLLWIKTACSNLQQLNLSNCPQFSADFASYLSSACPLIEAADFSRGTSLINYAKPTTLRTQRLLAYSYPLGAWVCLHYLVRLSVAGHTELRDSEFALISIKCRSITEITLSGCSDLTDSAIAKFLQCHPRLRSFRAAFTAFGYQSLCVLVSTSEQECSLEELDLGHCKDLSAGALVRLLTRLSSLVVLSLCYTSLINDGLFHFGGTSLKSLNIRGTEVSGAAVAYILRRNRNLTSLNFRDCRRAFSCEDLPKDELQLLDLKAGWGFSHVFTNTKLPRLQTLTLGLGAEITDAFLYELPGHCPQLARLSLFLQDISDDSLEYSLLNLSYLTTLKLRHTLQPLSGDVLKSLPANLVSLTLEDACPSLTNSQLASIATACKNLRQLSLKGCSCLGSGALHIVARGWPGLRQLKLEDCSEVTRKGVSALFDLYGLEKLVLRHNGAGLLKSFVIDASDQLPLLRCLSLDSCDTTLGHFETPKDGKWKSLSAIRISHCRSVLTPYSFEGRIRKCHRHTEVLERGGSTLRTFIIRERL